MSIIVRHLEDGSLQKMANSTECPEQFKDSILEQDALGAIRALVGFIDSFLSDDRLIETEGLSRLLSTNWPRYYRRSTEGKPHKTFMRLFVDGSTIYWLGWHSGPIPVAQII